MLQRRFFLRYKEGERWKINKVKELFNPKDRYKRSKYEKGRKTRRYLARSG